MVTPLQKHQKLTLGLQFAKQFHYGAPVPLGAPGIDFQSFGQPLRVRGNLGSQV